MVTILSDSLKFFRFITIPTAQIAYQIVTKIERQMNDLRWNEYRF